MGRSKQEKKRQRMDQKINGTVYNKSVKIKSVTISAPWKKKKLSPQEQIEVYDEFWLDPIFGAEYVPGTFA